MYAAPTEPFQLFSLFKSLQPHPSLSFWVDLTVLRENWQKKQTKKMTYPCLRGSYLMPHFWIIPLFIGLDISHHALVMRFADFVIFPEFVLNSVPVVFSFLSTSLILWDDMSEMAAWTGWHQRGWKVPNGHSCSREYHLWIHVLRTTNDVKADVCFLILRFYLS